jgi:hypothetical protein
MKAFANRSSVTQMRADNQPARDAVGKDPMVANSPHVAMQMMQLNGTFGGTLQTKGKEKPKQKKQQPGTSMTQLAVDDVAMEHAGGCACLGCA